MGFQEKNQVEVAESEIWVIAGISLRAPLRPIKTRASEKGDVDEEEGEQSEMTPTKKESRIPERLICPPAPKKPKPSLLCHLDGVQFFSTPDDLESVFARRAERVK